MYFQRIRMNEVKDALRRMKTTKAMGSVEVPLEFQKCFGDVAVCLLTNLFNKILSDSKRPSVEEKYSNTYLQEQGRTREIFESFALVTDELTKSIQEKVPWGIFFQITQF